MADEAQSTTSPGAPEAMKEYIAGRLGKKRPKRRKTSPEVLASKPPKKGRAGFPRQDDFINWE